MIDYKDLEPHLRGLWHDIFASIGVTIPKMRGANSANHACPLCGGDDRAHWRLQDGRLSLYCRHCAADAMHSPESVYMQLTGQSFGDMCKALAAYVNHVPLEVRANIAKASSAKAAPSYYADCSESDIEAALAKCQEVPLTPLTLRYGIGADGLLMNAKQETVCVIEREGKRVGLAVIGDDEKVRFLGGKQPQYGVTLVGARRKGKPVYMCASWVDAHIVHMLTGAQVACCWSVTAMRDMAWHMAKHVESGMLRAACNIELNELAEMEKCQGLQVIVPDDAYRIWDAKAMQRKVYCASELEALIDGLVEKE